MKQNSIFSKEYLKKIAEVLSNPNNIYKGKKMLLSEEERPTMGVKRKNQCQTTLSECV